jgi:hypothetical protein
MMRAAMLATIWLALAGFVAGEAGKSRHRRTGIEPRWAWAVWCAGLVACVTHILIAMAHRHGWSHEAAVLETARQTAAVYGLAWRGGVYVNYVFVGIWLAQLAWWRIAPQRFHQRPVWMLWAERAFYFVIIVNAAVIFAAPDRRLAGAAVTGALVAAWLW